MKKKSAAPLGLAAALLFGAASLAACTASGCGVDLGFKAVGWQAKEFWRMNVRPLLLWPKHELEDKADAERRAKALTPATQSNQTEAQRSHGAAGAVEGTAGGSPSRNDGGSKR
jgi:hypothetical protein